MNNKIDLLTGIIIGFVATTIGCYIFIRMYTSWDFISGIQIFHQQGYLGKIITLGAIVNMIIFAFLLKMKKDFMARGIIISVIALTIFTLFL